MMIHNLFVTDEYIFNCNNYLFSLWVVCILKKIIYHQILDFDIKTQILTNLTLI